MKSKHSNIGAKVTCLQNARNGMLPGNASASCETSRVVNYLVNESPSERRHFADFSLCTGTECEKKRDGGLRSYEPSLARLSFPIIGNPSRLHNSLSVVVYQGIDRIDY